MIKTPAHRRLPVSGVLVVAFPSVLAVTVLEGQSQQVGFFAPKQPRLGIGIDAQGINSALIVKEHAQYNRVAGNLGSLVGIVDLRQPVKTIVETKAYGI